MPFFTCSCFPFNGKGYICGTKVVKAAFIHAKLKNLVALLLNQFSIQNQKDIMTYMCVVCISSINWNIICLEVLLRRRYLAFFKINQSCQFDSYFFYRNLLYKSLFLNLSIHSCCLPSKKEIQGRQTTAWSSFCTFLSFFSHSLRITEICSL